MNTVAVTIDDRTLRDLDRLAKDRRQTRSAMVREAVRRLVEQERRRGDEQRDAILIHRHRKELARQAAALVREQARD